VRKVSATTEGLIIGVSGDGIGRPATRAKALNLYTGTFSRV